MNKLLAILLGRTDTGFAPFGPAKRTVESALVHFSRAIDELKAVEQEESAEADRQQEIIFAAEAAQSIARAQAIRANRTRLCISNLVSDEAVADYPSLDLA